MTRDNEKRVLRERRQARAVKHGMQHASLVADQGGQHAQLARLPDYVAREMDRAIMAQYPFIRRGNR